MKDNYPPGAEHSPLAPFNQPEVPDLCRICQRHEIEQLAEDIICEMFGPDEAGSMAAEVEKQRIIDSYSEACSDCLMDENFMNDD